MYENLPFPINLVLHQDRLTFRSALNAMRSTLNALPKLFLQYFYGQPHHLLHYLHINVCQLFNIDTTLAYGKLAKSGQ